MAAKGRRRKSELSGFLEAQLRTVTDTFQMMDAPARTSLEKVPWADAAKLADDVSRAATVAGMLWNGDTPDIDALKENITAYFNTLQGFLLLCYGTTAGAGPTLHGCIHASAKRVVDSSFTLFKGAVSAYESGSREKRLLIPQLTGAVWEACEALKKVPATNCTAIGRAVAQVGIYLKDILREMHELPISESTEGPAGSSGTTEKDEWTSDQDLGDDDDLSPEEIAVARLVVRVASDALLVVKDIIRCITGLLKGSGVQQLEAEDTVESMEMLLSCCKQMADQVNDLAACVYPPQDESEMKTLVKNLRAGVCTLCNEVGKLSGDGGAPDGGFTVLGALEKSLRELEAELGGDVVDEIEKLAL